MADLRFLLRITQSNYGSGSNYFKVAAEIAYMVTPERSDDSGVRSPLWESYLNPGEVGHFDSFAVTAQRDAQESEHFLPFYGFHIGFQNPYFVDMKRAESMTKILRKIERKLAAFETEHGYAPDFATYLTRVGIALGMKGHCYGVYSQEMRADGTHYRWMNANTLREFFTGDEWRKYSRFSNIA